MSATYVNLKELSEFNKYVTALGSGIVVYLDKLTVKPSFPALWYVGLIAAGFTVVSGVLAMSARGRLKGDDFDYGQEPDENRKFVFRWISRALYAQLFAVIVAVACVSVMAFARVWKG